MMMDTAPSDLFIFMIAFWSHEHERFLRSCHCYHLPVVNALNSRIINNNNNNNNINNNNNNNNNINNNNSDDDDDKKVFL